MAIARVQSNHAEAVGAGTTISVSLTGVGANALIVDGISQDASGTISSVTDDLSVNAQYAKDVLASAFGQREAIWYFEGHGGGNRTFSANFPSGLPFRQHTVAEYSGAKTSGALEGTAAATGSGSTPSTGNVSPNPSVNGCLIVSAICDAVSGVAQGSPFSLVWFDSTATNSGMEDYVQTTAAAIAGVWATSAAAYGVVAAVFLPAPTASAALGGTGVPNMTSTDVVAGGKTVTITLTGANWLGN